LKEQMSVDRKPVSHEQLSQEQRDVLRCVRAVGIDVDYTLLTSDHKISDANRKALADAHRAGISVHLITGRSLQTLQTVLDSLPLSDLIVASGGAFIYDPIEQIVIDQKLIPRSVAEIVVREARAARAAVFVYYPEAIYMEATAELLEGFHAATDYRPVQAVDVLGETSGDPNKIALYGEYSQLKDTASRARDGGADLCYTFPHSYFLDITHSLASKGEALRRMCSLAGILPEEMLVIGDGENDLSMFTAAGFGAAVANAAPALIEASDWVVPSNDQDGVAYVIQQLLALQNL
jgi:Cof subfamily protein (haloacid dehalogenase superfamily)